MCRVANSANVIKDGNFDTTSALSNWTRNSTTWVNSDADQCPLSGSVTIVGFISRCFQVPTVPAGGKQYSLGVRFKATDSGQGCLGMFYQDSNCMQSAGTADFLNMSAGGSDTWSSSLATSDAPEGTSSILVQCNGYDSGLTLDQIFLRVSGPSGSGF